MKNKENTELYIPEMEKVEDIKVEKEQLKVEDTKKEDTNIEKTNDKEEITNSQQFLDMLQQYIDDFDTLFKKAQTLNFDVFKNKVVILNGDKLSLFIARHQNNKWVKLLEKISHKDSKVNITIATLYCKLFLKDMYNDCLKMIKQKRPFLNDQHFAEIDSIKINGNDKLDFLENAMKLTNAFMNDLKSYDMINTRFVENAEYMFGQYYRELNRIYHKGFDKLRMGKNFAELNERLKTINYCR